MVLYAFLFLMSFLAAFAQPLFAAPDEIPSIDATDLAEQLPPTENPLLARADFTAQSGAARVAETSVEDDETPTEITPNAMTAKDVMLSKASAKPDKQTGKKSATSKDDKVDGKERNDIYLNFENSSLANVVNYMAELRNINLLPDKGLADVKVSLTIREPLTIDGAWNIFLTLLEVSGFSIVEVGGLHKVMAKDKKLTEALPIYINVPYTSLPDSDLTVRYVMFLQNLQVDSIRDLLESLLSDNKRVFPYAQANCFIITDRCYNIKSAMKVIQELDAMGQPETVVVMRLKRTNASDVKGLIEGLMSKKQDGNPLARFFAKPIESTTEYFPSGTKIVAEDRTNQLILMGSPGPIKKIEDFILRHIDVDLKGTESPLHIYELQYADATAVAEILQAVTAPPDQGPGQQAAKYGAVRGGVKYFKSMKFQVDKDANRLIVSCTDKQDWEMLKLIIKDLDKPQPQVAIETLYVSITESDMKQMGGSMRNKKEGQLGKGIDFQAASLKEASLKSDDGGNPVSLLGNMLHQLVTSRGSTMLTFGRSTNIWAVFNMLKSQSNASILSQPFITVANKVQGKITVGSDKNVVTEESDTGKKAYGVVNAETLLEVTPQINLDGVIRLNIHVSISEFTDETVGNRSKNELTTNISMADGQVLVLGGFVQTKVGESTNKTPLLADIPLLGWFFKNQSRNVNRNYIFIFMAPTIVKPRSAPGVELYSKMKLHSATSEIENGIKTSKTNDPLFNWYFDPKKENYSHKVVDFANARYQPTTVDIKNDAYYRANINDDQREKSYGQPVVTHAPTMVQAGSNQPIIQAPVSTETAQPGPIITTQLADPAIATQPLSSNTISAPSAAVTVPPQSVMTNPTSSSSAPKTAPTALPSLAEQLEAMTPSGMLPRNNVMTNPTLKTLQAPAPLATPGTPEVKSSYDPNKVRAEVSARLELPTIQAPQPQNKLVDLAHQSQQQEERLETGAPNLKPEEQEAIVEAEAYTEPHPAKQDVLNLLGARMQQQRHIDVDNEQLSNQRKKLKSLISQSFNNPVDNGPANNPRNEKQDALKTLLAIPASKPSRQGQLVVDPAKRNSLKDFLSQAEQPAPTTRNNPA